MRCHLLLVAHLVAILSVRQSRPAAAAGVPGSLDSMSRWCADASMEDLIATSEACQKAETLGGGVGCWAYVDAVLQLCLEEATAAAGQLDRHDPADGLSLLKRNRNKFLGKRGGASWKRGDGSRNNFLGKRGTAALFRSLADAVEDGGDDKRSRNKFLGKRAEQSGGGGVELRATSAEEKKSRNNFLGKRNGEMDELSRLMGLGNDDGEKRSRNRFLGKKDHQPDVKRSRNKFLGKREAKATSALDGTHL